MEDIRIVSVDKGRAHIPDQRYSALYNIYLTLNRAPDSVWVDFFDQSRSFPRHSMWRRAWVEGNNIVIYCAPEELDRFHLKDLKEDVATANEKYKAHVTQQATYRQAQEEREAAERKKLDDTLDKLKFD